MLELKLAWRGLVHHGQQYGMFVFASAVLVALNYIFTALVNNSSLHQAMNGRYLIIIARLCLIFVLMLAVVFMFYVNSFLLQQRDRELGLYNMLGLTRGNLGMIMFWENLMLYIAAVGLGLLAGISFLKIAFLVLQHLTTMQHLHEEIKLASVNKVAVMFGIIYGLLLLYDIGRMRRVKPITLWQQANAGEQEPRSHWVSGILGVICLGAGFVIAVRTHPNISAFFSFMGAIILVVIGTYLVFISGSILLLKFLKNRPQYYYQPQHFIAVSGMLHRMKQNGASLASICLLCTSILVTMIMTASLYFGSSSVLRLWNPYDVMISQPQPLNKTQQQQLHQLAHRQQLQVQPQHQLTMTQPVLGEIQGSVFVKSQATPTYQLATLTVANYNHLNHTHYHLKANEILFYSPDSNLHLTQLTIKQQHYKVRMLHHFNLYFNYGHSATTPLFVVAANRTQAQAINPQRWLTVTGFNLRGKPQRQIHFAQQMQALLQLDSSMYSVRAQMAAFWNSLFGGFFFLGILISIAMALTTALMIYYKQIAEGTADRQRFWTMQQVGLSWAESRKAIYSQVLTVFFLPIVGAVVITGFALPAIISVLKVFSLYNIHLLLAVAAITLLLLIILYVALYLLTTQVYSRLVRVEFNPQN